MSLSIKSLSNTTIQPIWLDSKYIEDAIRFKNEDNSITITNFNIFPATVSGENYASVLLRIGVEYVNNNSREATKVSYILKTSFDQLKCPVPNSRLTTYDVFKREMMMYETIFPQFQDILRTIGCNDGLVPESIKIDQRLDAILLVDLKDQNYVTMDRKMGLNLLYAKNVLKKLVKFHAASLILNEMDSTVFEEFNSGIFGDTLTEFYSACMDACAHAVSQWKGYEQYGVKLANLKNQIINLGKNLFRVKENGLNVLLHGDLWTNNLMFKLNGREVVDMVFVDFQFSCWASATLDLHYLFYTSLEDSVRDHCIEELLCFYYADLRETLHKLQFSGVLPTFDEFRAEYEMTGFYDVITACIERSIILNETSDGDSNFNIFTNDESTKKFRTAVYKNPQVERELKKLLPIFDRKGLLNIS